jgi:PhnB protein
VVLHARLAFDDNRSLMASDWMDSTPYQGMKSFAVALGYKKVDEARRIFDALAEGGQVSIPFSKTFWTEGFGMLTDRFGTHWMVSGESA